MNIEKIKAQLEQLYPLSGYPKRNIIVINNEKAQEIICELGDGKAIVVLDRSIPHYHKETTEMYTVLQGDLQVYKNQTAYFLSPREKISIAPEVPHYAIGNETWVLVTSDPPWTEADHFLIE